MELSDVNDIAHAANISASTTSNTSALREGLVSCLVNARPSHLASVRAAWRAQLGDGVALSVVEMSVCAGAHRGCGIGPSMISCAAGAGKPSVGEVGRLRRKSRNFNWRDARCSRRRAPHDPAPHVRALPFRASPRGQRLAAAFLDLMFEATPARLPSAAPSLGGARANSTPSFQRSLGAQAPHERCAHSSRPLARLALDPRDPARAPGPAPLPPRCASERRV